MAKHSGIFPVAGTIDNMTFYTSQDGFIIKKAATLMVALQPPTPG